MCMRGLAIIAALWMLAAAGAPAQSKYFPIEDVRPGMIGIGRTVFEGDRLDEFKVNIIGVLHNQIGPRRDLVLARLEGGPLAKTGVIGDGTRRAMPISRPSASASAAMSEPARPTLTKTSSNPESSELRVMFTVPSGAFMFRV